MVKRSVFKTGKSLQYAIENPERIKGMQDYLDMNFAYLYFDLYGEVAEEAFMGKLFEVPYWIGKYHGKETKDYETKYWAQYVPEIYEPLNIGHIEEIGGKKYKLVDHVSLDEEVEHQAENGDVVYEYRGPSYLRIWELLEE